MKLKLTYIQFMSLLNLFRELSLLPMPTEMEDKLIHAHMLTIYQKFYAKAIMKNKSYSIKLTAPEAIAFWLNWVNAKLPAEMVFEKNLLLTINNNIEQKFTTSTNFLTIKN
jgi:hypothetical protein